MLAAPGAALRKRDIGAHSVFFFRTCTCANGAARAGAALSGIAGRCVVRADSRATGRAHLVIHRSPAGHGMTTAAR